MNDIPIISADMGADAPKVPSCSPTVWCLGWLISNLHLYDCAPQKQKNNISAHSKSQSPCGAHQIRKTYRNGFLQTISVAAAFGIIGRLLNIPAGVFLFSTIGVICFKLLYHKAYMPMWAKRLAQLLSGAYIGCSMSYKDVLELRCLVIPALLLVLGYFATCYVVGITLSKHFGMSLKEAMLVATPAGAADMTLISLDMGAKSTDLMVLQIMRLIVVIMLFPQIINMIVMLAG